MSKEIPEVPEGEVLERKKRRRKKWSEKSMVTRILMIAGLTLLALVLWMAFDVVKGLLTKDAPRKPNAAGDTADYSYSNLQKAVWLIEHPDKENYSIYYAQTTDPDDSLFAWREIPNSVTHDSLCEANLLDYIRPASEYMGKRYDCADFRAIWLCKLRYALINSPEYGSLLTGKVDDAIKDALTGFKYWITSEGKDSMCYYSENHQMVFAVSEYYAGLAYPNEIFSIDGKSGLEHSKIAKERMENWFDQRGRYGFSEFLSSNYLAVDIGALSMLLTYCDDAALSKKTEAALNMILLDYSLSMFDYGFTAPAGRNYARNNTSFNASTSSHVIVDKIWNTGETDLENWYSGFPYLFISLCDSGRYFVPKAIVALGEKNDKGVVKSTSGLSLKEMEEKGLIGLSDYQLMFQLGMGALSNGEVIENTLEALNKYDLVHNNFVSSFKFFNIKLLQYLGLTKKIAAALDPFSNGMAIQRNEVYSFSTKDYKLSTDQLYFPGSYGAQQLQFIACLPDRINVFTTNPMKSKEFQGYGVAPCAAQNENCMLSVFNIPEKKPLLATGDVRSYTSTYFPEEDFDEVLIDGSYAFGRINDTYIALIGSSALSYVRYSDKAEFEKKIFDTYEFYETEVGPYVDSYRLKDMNAGFDLRQQGNSQYMIYELGSADNESFSEFVERIKSNRVEFSDNVLTYSTKNAGLSEDVTYTLDYSGSFMVNNEPVNTEHDRYDSTFVHTLRSDDKISVSCDGEECVIDLKVMYK